MFDIGWYLSGVLTGAILVTALCYYRWQQWREETTAELENQLQQHNFELQITLEELAEKNKQLEQQTLLDSLSGTYNRACFDQKMQSELRRSRREQRPLALLLLDIDYFKKINDSHGHLAGDQVIRAVAAQIQQCLKRASDTLCRYGGEEFAIILPNTDSSGATELAEQIRLRLAETPIQIQQQTLQVHISGGCYAAIAQQYDTAEHYIQQADIALYKAKAAGRNQIYTEPTPETNAGQTDESQ